MINTLLKKVTKNFCVTTYEIADAYYEAYKDAEEETIDEYASQTTEEIMMNYFIIQYAYFEFSTESIIVQLRFGGVVRIATSSQNEKNKFSFFDQIGGKFLCHIDEYDSQYYSARINKFESLIYKGSPILLKKKDLTLKDLIGENQTEDNRPLQAALKKYASEDETVFCTELSSKEGGENAVLIVQKYGAVLFEPNSPKPIDVVRFEYLGGKVGKKKYEIEKITQDCYYSIKGNYLTLLKLTKDDEGNELIQKMNEINFVKLLDGFNLEKTRLNIENKGYKACCLKHEDRKIIFDMANCNSQWQDHYLISAVVNCDDFLVESLKKKKVGGFDYSEILEPEKSEKEEEPEAEESSNLEESAKKLKKMQNPPNKAVELKKSWKVGDLLVLKYSTSIAERFVLPSPFKKQKKHWSDTVAYRLIDPNLDFVDSLLFNYTPTLNSIVFMTEWYRLREIQTRI